MKVLATTGYQKPRGVRFVFDRRDAWIGAYFDTTIGNARKQVYVCLLPMLVIHFWWATP